MDPNLQRHFDAVFDAHEGAIRGLRVANTALATATSALATAIQANDEAIGAALDANRAAIDLLHRLSNGSPPS